MKKIVDVVAGIIENEKNEILCVKRSREMSLPNFWEFPGGKIEKGESIFQALARELSEELEISGEISEEIFLETLHEYEKIKVNLICIKVKNISSEPNLKEHSEKLWLKRPELNRLQWAPADIETVKKLQRESK
ncbi:MAG: (deoxy)nucleoside triphosphate pyrophosphohydrolase [Fusobacteriaceae bacterium]